MLHGVVDERQIGSTRGSASGLHELYYFTCFGAGQITWRGLCEANRADTGL